MTVQPNSGILTHPAKVSKRNLHVWYRKFSQETSDERKVQNSVSHVPTCVKMTEGNEIHIRVCFICLEGLDGRVSLKGKMEMEREGASAFLSCYILNNVPPDIFLGGK